MIPKNHANPGAYVKHSSFAVVLVLAVSACATTNGPPSVPVDAGPTAIVKDSTHSIDRTKAEFFILYELNGKHVDNALSKTIDRNEGAGASMMLVDAERPVPAHPATFHIAGRTHYAAPVLELTGTVYFIEGDVLFTPEAGASYVVKGELGPEQSSVWIENEKTGAQVSDKLVIKGSAEAGMFKKHPPVVHSPPGQ
jgi:hypothetical protein